MGRLCGRGETLWPWRGALPGQWRLVRLRGALGPFLCKFLSEEKPRKTHESPVVVRRENQ